MHAIQRSVSSLRLPSFLSLLPRPPLRKDLDSTENDVLVNGLAELSATRNIGVRIRAVYVGF